ncbi:ABC transporter substrate-binding protein [Glaciihabitans sp. dw_435]|uniref:ABC transporter substrate-binding protein n=1 Tax=Glaciihabitans sp. dw_435 TaxID=2720081 RepID=UPI0027DBAD22|nr:ABC transporter substrate-binding protein [Glaciihabitans sp. dw_435]
MNLTLSPRTAAAAVLLSALAMAGLTACSTAAAPSATSPSTRSVTTQLGDVSVPTSIKSVVVIEGRRDLDIVLSLGLPLVGYPYEEAGSLDLPSPMATELTAAKAKGAKELFLADEINVEAIAEAAPTLIVSRVDDVEPIIDQLTPIAPVIAIGEQDVSSWQDDLRLVASATGTEAKADTLIAAYDARVKELSTTYATVLKEHTFAPVSIDDEGSQTRPNRLLSSVLRDLGATPSAAFATSIKTTEGAKFGPEQLLSAFSDADGLIALVNEPAVWTAVQANPLYKQLPAVENGHVVRSDKQTHEGAALTAMHCLDVIESLLKTF